MWAKVDDTVTNHPKFVRAGLKIGRNGKAIAIGFWTYALLWTNTHLTDGFVPLDILKTFTDLVENPANVADALVTAGLFDKADGGFSIHDYHDHNPTAAAVKRRRKEDRLRKQAERNGQRGHA